MSRSPLGAIATLFFAAVVSLSFAVVGAELVVISTVDRGQGTLRWALQTARSGDVITFDPDVFPPDDPATIRLKSGLPVVQQGNLTIDASDAGIILDGRSISGDWVPGLEITSSGNVVRGVQIVHFTGAGIFLCCGARDNVIGGDGSIGSGPMGQGNLLSDNSAGILLAGKGTSSNVIAGNLVGTGLSGQSPLGNQGVGIFVEGGASYNLIGPDNIISYNGTGVYVTDGATDNRIGPNNTIAFNREEGVQIYNPGSARNTITRNSIHDNAVIGILLNDNGNNGLKPPLISEFDLKRGIVAGSSCAGCVVELFSDAQEEGKVFEGKTTADVSGRFQYDGSGALIGPHVTATATDPSGNTSAFATPTSGLNHIAILQQENDSARRGIQSKEARYIEDNSIGVHFINLWHLEPEAFPDFVLDAEHLLGLGTKNVRFSVNDLDSHKVDWSKPDFSIDSAHDRFISSLADNGVAMTYVLSFWDTERATQGWTVPSPRFKTETEIERYLSFARFIVGHFKDRIERYEIWNEPSIPDMIQSIEVEDYLRLVRRAVPVMREEYPKAKIVVGGTHSLIDEASQDYLSRILRSDVMRLVDVVSWHPMYGSSPEYDWHREYYYDYPAIVRSIKSVAIAHGFQGEFVADEIHWNTPDIPEPPWPTYTETKSVKYYLRSTLTHLGLDVSVTQILLPNKTMLLNALRNLNTVMAGHEPIDMPVEIDIDHDGPVAYCSFRYLNGDRMLAVWTDGIAQDDDPGVPATITFPGLVAGNVTGIDVLHGFEQEVVFEIDDGSTIVRDLLAKDYPILIRLSDVSFGPGYREIDGDGFHRLGGPGASSSGSPGNDEKEEPERPRPDQD